MSEAVLAVDIGGTKTAVALVTEGGELLGRAEAPTPALAGGPAVLDVVAELASGLLGIDESLTVLRIGVGTAGVVESASGRITASTDTFTNWVGTDIPAELQVRLSPRLGSSLAVGVLNDVNAHALGELVFGAARGSSEAIMVAVGTGIGAGIISGGQVQVGAHSQAGEIAHLPTPGADGLQCPCGRFGHLEAIGCGAGIVRLFHHLGGAVELTTARQVVEQAAAGDATALHSVTESAIAVGRALAGIAVICDPEVIVIGGGVADIGPMWWQPFQDAVAQTLPAGFDGPSIRPSELGSRSALLGAAAAAWRMGTE